MQQIPLFHGAATYSALTTGSSALFPSPGLNDAIGFPILYRLASLVRFTLGYFRVGIEGEYPIGMAFGGAAKYRYDVHRRSR